MGKTLGDLASKEDFYKFGYDNMVRKAKSIDVSWFNIRKMPSAFFEVEHSTNIQNSLLKFVELQDYNVNFFIVADKIRKTEYLDKVSLNAFTSIKSRVKFIDYENVSEWHARMYEFSVIENNLGLRDNEI